jgi:Uma2 family endonuclease
MSRSYEEVIEGVNVLRPAPGARHEALCNCLHERVAAAIGPAAPVRLLERRSVVQAAPGTFLRPDLALVTLANDRLYLAVEIVSSEDHRWDTVTKKEIYENLRLARLWMVDPRYNNVEMYHGTPHGIALRNILAGSETLTDVFLPALALSMDELFDAGRK